MTTNSRPDELLTTPEVAAVLRVTPETVRRMARSSRLKGFVLSDRGGWRFRRADLEEFIRRAFKDKAKTKT